MPQQMDFKEEVLSAVRQFARSVNVNRKVIADMSLLVNATTKISLANLDAWERLLRWEFFAALESTKPPKWKMWTQQTPFLTWIDLCSGDGFKREKTLRTLTGAAPNSFFFALAIRRLNDWVPQVREAAREKIPEIAKNSDPEYVVDALFTILPHWSSWGRMDNPEKQVIMSIISIPKVTILLKSRIISATSGPMPTILSQVGRAETLDHYLFEIAKNAIQPSVRAKAYRCLLENKMVWFAGRKWKWTDKQYCKGRLEPILCERTLSVESPFKETLKLAMKDRSPIVRRVAAEMFTRKLELIGEESVQFAELIASDSSHSVAEWGKWALNKLEK